MTTDRTPRAHTLHRSAFRPTLRNAVVAAAMVAVGALAAVAVPSAAFAGDGPAFPEAPTFQGPPTTPPPPQPPDPEVNPDLDPDIDDFAPATTTPEPPLPPQPPDPEVNPDLDPDIDDFAPATTAPEPPLPPEPPTGEDDEVAPNPPQECEPFDPAYPVVDISDDGATATVELSLQGDDQLQLCVTPLVVATYSLTEPAFGGEADLLGHAVVSSEDLDDWLLTGEPVTVTLPLDGCAHATVVFWGVAIPLDLDGVDDPPHVLTSAIGNDEHGCGGGPGGDPGGRLPETGAAVLAGIWLAAGLIGAGSLVWLVAAKRRRPSDQPTA